MHAFPCARRCTRTRRRRPRHRRRCCPGRRIPGPSAPGSAGRKLRAGVAALEVEELDVARAERSTRALHEVARVEPFRRRGDAHPGARGVDRRVAAAVDAAGDERAAGVADFPIERTDRVAGVGAAVGRGDRRFGRCGRGGGCWQAGADAALAGMASGWARRRRGGCGRGAGAAGKADEEGSLLSPPPQPAISNAATAPSIGIAARERVVPRTVEANLMRGCRHPTARIEPRCALFHALAKLHPAGVAGRPFSSLGPAATGRWPSPRPCGSAGRNTAMRAHGCRHCGRPGRRTSCFGRSTGRSRRRRGC